MKTFLVILFSFFVICGCSKQNDAIDIPSTETGKWRLESLFNPMTNKTIIYDKVNIVFSFGKNSVTVTGNDGSFYIQNGVYPYSLSETENSYIIKIGEREYPCSFEKDRMIFSWAFVDGDVITFRRLYFL